MWRTLTVVDQSMLPVLGRARIFDHLSPPALGEIAAHMVWRHFAPRHALMRQDEASEVMYVIAEGLVRVHRTEPGGQHLVLTELGEGAVVGEMGVLDRAPRSATVTAVVPVSALEISAEAITDVMVHHPEVSAALRHMVSQRLRDTDALVARMFADLLRKAAIFQPVSEGAIEHLAERGQRRHFFAGDVLMRQGESSVVMYVIAHGQVRVARSHPAILEPVVLAQLGPGEVVGEMGLLDGAPRSATVIADDDVEAMELDAQALASAMIRYPEIASALLHVVTQRMRTTDELLEGLLSRR